MHKNQLLKSIMAVVLGLLAGAVLMLVMGFDPLVAYDSLFKGGLKNITKIGDTIASATPLILTGLSVAFAFKTGLFNIGTPGQMLIGGFASLVVGLTVNLPSIILLPLMVLAGMIAGALCGAIPGLLKAKFNVHEVVSSIMMNWIVLYFTQYTIQNHFKGATEDTSRALGLGNTLKAEWLTKLFGNSNALNLGIFLAIIAAFIVWFILNKTVFGKNVYAIGGNREAAIVSGVNVFATVMGIFIFASLLYGVGGILEAARTAGATNNYGNGYELHAIAACVVGGVSVNGGVGKVGGIVSGVLIFTVIQYGLQFIAVSPMWQQVIKGVIIAVAVAIDLSKYRRK